MAQPWGEIGEDRGEAVGPRAWPTTVGFFADAKRGAHTVAVTGELDLSTQPLFDSVLEVAANAARSGLVVDLAGCEFIDAGAARSILALGNGSGRPPAVLCERDGQVARLLGLLGIPHVRASD